MEIRKKLQTNIRPIMPSESVAVDLLRALAFVVIVIGHFLQSYKSEWASFCVIGVQIFFVLSGFLYGKKTVTDWGKWYFGRLIKLYIPYLLLILVVTALSHLMGSKPVSLSQFSSQLVGLEGLFNSKHVYFNHLWFMEVLVCCYVITPFLQIVRKRAEIAQFVTIVLFVFFCKFYRWTPLYILLYSFAYLSGNSNKRFLILSLTIITLLCIFLLLQVHLDDFILFSPRAMIIKSGTAMVLLYFILMITRWLNMKTVCGGIKYLSGYSFEGYLVHISFIIGPLSVAYATNCVWVNFLLVCVSTTIASLLLKYVCELINNQIPFINKR